MPKVSRGSRKDYEPADADFGHEPVRASSVLFGLVIIAALIVASAAWMGGSMSDINRRVAGLVDSAARASGLAVQTVSIVGLDDQLEEIVRAAAMVEPGENMLRADPHRIRRDIEATGAVSGVRVYRLWPDVILINAAPARPTALWRDGSDWRVIDAGGEVRDDLQTAAFPSLPRFAGPDVPDHLPDLLARLETAPSVRERFRGAVRRGDGRWSLVLEGDVIVHLPADELVLPSERRRAGRTEETPRMTAALQAVEAMQVRQSILDGRFATIDARTAAPRRNVNRPAQIILLPRGTDTARVALASEGRAGTG